MRFMKWAGFVAKRCKSEGKKIKVISVSHHEFLTPIMEDVFKFDIHHGEGYKKTEIMRLTFKYDEQSDIVLIDADMRGKKLEGIYFDPNKQRFFIHDKV